MKKILAFTLALIMALSVAACGSSSDSTPSSTDTSTDQTSADTVDTAPELEDKLVVYCTLTEVQVQAAQDTFNAVYPDVEVEFVSGGAGELISRLRAEANNPVADVMLGGLSDTDGDENADIFMPYVSQANDDLISGASSDNGFYNYNGTSTVCFCVNTDLEAQMGIEITSYADLLNPALKGKIVMADPNSSSSAWNNICNFESVYGVDSDEMWNYLEQLMPNLVVVSSSSATYKNVYDGEYVVGLTYETGAITLIADGAENLRLVFPSEGTSAMMSGLAIVKDCPHPEAAKAFLEYYMSAEGMNANGEIVPNVRRTHNDFILSGESDMIPSSEITWVDRPLEEIAATKDTVLEKWNALYAKYNG